MSTYQKEKTTKKEEEANKLFFHKTINVSKWMKKKITDLMASKDCQILESDISCEVMTRMSKLSVLNTITLKFVDEKKRLRELSNYSSIDKDYDGSHGLSWLITGIKELETKAALEFGGSLVGEKSFSVEKETLRDAVSISGIKGVTVKHVDVSLEAHLSCNAEELLSILSDSQKISLWTGKEVKEEEEVVFEGVAIRNIIREDNKVKMEYKNEKWDDYGNVEILVLQAGSDSYLKLKLTNVPSDYEEAVRNHWKQRIFGAISMIFRCVIKRIK